jgi:Protein of unknown function (DUF4199)
MTTSAGLWTSFPGRAVKTTLEIPMKKTILTFGLISGAILSVLMAATVPFAHKIGFNRALLVGYTTMVLSFLMVYFGIRSYRDNLGGGYISFGRAFTIGLAITLISSVCYVLTWEVMYFKFMPDFMDEYNAHAIQKMQASGASAAAIETKVKELQDMKRMYDNPLMNAAMTIVEPLPVGLVITLASAAILRRKPKQQPAQTPATAPS